MAAREKQKIPVHTHTANPIKRCLRDRAGHIGSLFASENHDELAVASVFSEAEKTLGMGMETDGTHESNFEVSESPSAAELFPLLVPEPRRPPLACFFLS